MATTTELPFFAGVDDNEQPVFESIKVEILDPDKEIVRLLHSPLFARNLAAGDHVRVVNLATAEYALEKRSGNLSVRVMRKDGIEAVAHELVPQLEKLGGKLDMETEHALVFSIHFSIGFVPVERLLNEAREQYSGTVWYYGNVYDPSDGVTPLRWWQDFDGPA